MHYRQVGEVLVAQVLLALAMTFGGTTDIPLYPTSHVTQAGPKQ